MEPKLDLSTRILLITRKVSNNLRQWEIPPHLKPEDQIERIRQVAEGINAKCPASYGKESISDRADVICKYVTEHHKAAKWPSVAEYVTAAGQTALKETPEGEQIEGGNISFDSDAIASRRIKAGKRVGATYVNGTGMQRLIHKNMVTPEDLRRYQGAYFEQKVDAWGIDAAQQHDKQAEEKLKFINGKL